MRAAVVVVAAGLVAFVCLPLSSGATPGENPSTGEDSARDPEDVDSRLDIVFVSYVGNGDGMATLTLRTAERWPCRYLAEPGDDVRDTAFADLYWEYSTSDTTGARIGDFKCERGGDGLVFILASQPSEQIRAERPSPRTATVVIRLRYLEEPSQPLTLWAKSRVSGLEEGGLFLDEEDVTPKLRPR